MLNRRLVRIRVMQHLYAFEKAKMANYLLAQDVISEAFLPDLNAVVREDKVKLTGLSKLATAYFEDEVLNDQFNSEEPAHQRIDSTLVKAREYYKLKNKKDYEFYKNQIIIDAEKVYDLYLMILKLLVEITEKFPKKTHLPENRIIKALSAQKNLDFAALKRNVSWENETAFVNKVYNEAFVNNAHITAYQEKVNVSSEDELVIVKYIFKNIFLKHESCSDFFEKESIFWTEDTEILRTMLFHSVNDFNETGLVEIEKLDGLWDETKEFMNDLFRQTILQDKEIMDFINPKLKNWKTDRVITIDKILLKMAVSEIMNFSSIPLKVTINEIIEIAKNYSSAKSGIFINGILDSIIKELSTKKLIKKTGRGMIDNK